MQIAAINVRYAYTTLLILIVSIGIVSPIATAGSAAINIGSYTTYAGSNVIVPIEIKNASDVAGGSANISFNPSIVNVEEVLSGNFSLSVPHINNTAGFVSIATAGLTPVGKENASLAIIRFKGISKGISALNFTDASVSDETGYNVTYPETSNGTIHVLSPPTPFFIYGYVFYESGSECHNPKVNVTNLNASNVWNAETKEGYNYYQLVLASGTNVNASEILRFNVISPDGSQSKVFNHTVTPEEINKGGLFNFNITFGTPAPTPTLVEYTISNRTITPPQTTAIDVEFSEKVKWRIAIENGGSAVYDWTGTSTNPTKRIWNGTYETTGTIVPDGMYTVNITWTNTTTGLGGQNNTETITVVTEVVEAPTADSFGVEDAGGRSGTYVEVPVSITNVMNGPVQGIRLRVGYTDSVLNLMTIGNGDLTSAWTDLRLGEDRRTMVIATAHSEDAIPIGSSGSVIRLNFSVIGSPGDTSPMNMTLIELSNLGGDEVGTAPAKNGTFRVSELDAIVGRITYACNGTGIAGVNVNLTKEGAVVNTAVTNETGYYNFMDVTPDSYFVNASKPRFWDNSMEVTVIAGETTTADMTLWLKGDLNNDGSISDAGDVVLMLKASVGDISGDTRYDLNGNGEIADAGDVVLMLRASVGDIELL